LYVISSFFKIVAVVPEDALSLHMRWRAARGPTFHISATPQHRNNTSDISNALTQTRWLYLIFFNGLWVVFPLWILWEAYSAMSSAMSQAEMVDLVNYLKKDD
jgi:hypothetical protein